MNAKTTTAAAAKSADNKPTETPAAEAPKDPFAGLPTIKLGEATVLDVSSVKTSDARKYSKVAEDAAKDKLPVQRNWKHMTAVFILGTNKGGENGFKPGSVRHTIQDVVNRAGKQGISAYELATEVRKRQIGNKRSHYCTALPPVGWAEGWINNAVTVGIIKVHPTERAKGLITVADKGAEPTADQNKAAGAKG